MEEGEFSKMEGIITDMKEIKSKGKKKRKVENRLTIKVE